MGVNGSPAFGRIKQRPMWLCFAIEALARRQDFE